MLSGKVRSAGLANSRTFAVGTTEDEDVVLSEVFSEVLFLRQMREFMMAKLESYPAPIMKDGQEATKMANSKPAGRRTKHINIKYQIVRDTIAEGKVPINKVETKRQDADVPKTLHRLSFANHVRTVISLVVER